MVPIKTKEHLIYFMQCGMLRLSKYDLHFLQNLNIIVTSKIPVTSNQVILFEKVVEKYNRQLVKHGITKQILAGLNWESTIVPSDKKFTEAYIVIEDNKIFFRSPFNKKFLEKINRNNYKLFNWVKDKKHYESVFSTEALKYITKTSKEYFPIVNYCSVTSSLLNTCEQYNAKYWEPTLVKQHGKYIIAATNEYLHNALKDIELSSQPECLFLLSTYGIKIDDKIINGDPLLNFASSYITEVDYINIEDIIKYLHAVKCDFVYVAGHGIASQYKKTLVEKIKEANIPIVEKSSIILDEKIKSTNNPIIMFLTSDVFNLGYKFKKIVKVKNSTPVNIK